MLQTTNQVMLRSLIYSHMYLHIYIYLLIYIPICPSSNLGLQKKKLIYRLDDQAATPSPCLPSGKRLQKTMEQITIL